jgi:hypothetical protein
VLETQEITLIEVLRAGRVLYGPAFAAEGGAWRETLKATYRRRAMETHPDRARSLGRSERELSREFKAVADAYRVLSTLAAGANARGPTVRPPPAARPRRSRAAGRPSPPPSDARPQRPPERAPEPPPPQPRSAGRWTSGDEPPRPTARAAGPRVRVGVRPQDLPQRRLRFAEYLYYSGRVGWSALVEAIAWQRAQRPPLGRIAVDFGFLEPEDVGVILERRRRASAVLPFGEWAVREGYLTSFQLLAVLGQQLRLQRPIGQFFVERGLLEPEDIAVVRQRILRHNSRFLDLP